MAQDTTNSNAIIQEQVVHMLVEPLQAASVILSSNPLIIDSAEPVRIPTINSGTNPQWVGENELIPDGDSVDFGELQLMPTERKSIKNIVRVSNELIRAATDGVSGTLQTRIVNDVRNMLDSELLTGTGETDEHGTAVTGLLNLPDTTSLPLDLTEPDTVLDGLALMAANEVRPTVILMNGGDFFTMRKIKDGAGRPMIQPDLASDAIYRLHGVEVRVSNKVPAGTAALVDMTKVVAVRDIDPDITILAERYAEYDQTGIRSRTRYDIGVLDVNALVLLETAPAA